METYRLSVDRRYTIWEREYYMIEADERIFSNNPGSNEDR